MTKETDPLLHSKELKPSIARWWILFVASYIAWLQGCSWNCFGPISNAGVEELLHWHDGTIALLANWGAIAYLVAFLPTAWLFARGARLTTLLAAGLVLAGAGLRVITLRAPTVTYICHVAQILNGLAGPVAMVIGPVVSSLWFPAEQRTTATAIISMANTLGTATAFIIGPAMVPSRPTPLSAHDAHLTKLNLSQYLWLQFGLAGALFLSAVIYFPDKPRDAPTITAGEKRTSFWKGFWQLCRMPNFWLLLLAYSAITGVSSGWSAYLLQNLKHFRPADKAETESGWLGFYGTLAGVVGGVIVSKITDHIRGHMKFFLLLMCLGGTAFSLWFALMCINVTVRNICLIYVALIAVGLFTNAPTPLFYEAGVEVAYPIDEGTTTSVLTTGSNVACLIFLLLPDVPHLGYLWVNWFLFGSCVFSFLLLFLFRENYRRLNIDMYAIKAENILPLDA